MNQTTLGVLRDYAATLADEVRWAGERVASFRGQLTAAQNRLHEYETELSEITDAISQLEEIL